jgi:hypothetical protein
VSLQRTYCLTFTLVGLADTEVKESRCDRQFLMNIRPLRINDLPTPGRQKPSNTASYKQFIPNYCSHR